MTESKITEIIKGMTLEELGQKVGVGKSTVRKWETGAIANMRRDKIEKLAYALGCDPLELLNDLSTQTRNAEADRLYLRHANEIIEHAKKSYGPNYMELVNTSVHDEHIYYELSDAEDELIKLFRLVPEENRQMVLDMIRAALKSQGLLK